MTKNTAVLLDWSREAPVGEKSVRGYVVMWMNPGNDFKPQILDPDGCVVEDPANEGSDYIYEELSEAYKAIEKLKGSINFEDEVEGEIPDDHPSYYYVNRFKLTVESYIASGQRASEDRSEWRAKARKINGGKPPEPEFTIKFKPIPEETLRAIRSQEPEPDQFAEFAGISLVEEE
jgi:hypothetical protein